MEERIASAGGVSAALVDAYRSVLTESGADGAFVSAAISLPSTSELLDDITDADPLLLHEVGAAALPSCKWAQCPAAGTAARVALQFPGPANMTSAAALSALRGRACRLPKSGCHCRAAHRL